MRPPTPTTLFTFSWLPRYIDTAAGLAGPWDAPFIYEDRRHLFYVVTTESLRPIWTTPRLRHARPRRRRRRRGAAVPPLLLRQPVVASHAEAGRRRSPPRPATRPPCSATSRPSTGPGPWRCRSSWRSPTRAQVISPVGSLAATSMPPSPATEQDSSHARSRRARRVPRRSRPRPHLRHGGGSVNGSGPGAIP